MNRTQSVNSILEGLHRVDEKESFVVDYDLSQYYTVWTKSISGGVDSREKPKMFKDLQEAEKYAKKKVSSLKSAKTNTPSKYKEVVISLGDNIVKTFKVGE